MTSVSTLTASTLTAAPFAPPVSGMPLATLAPLGQTPGSTAADSLPFRANTAPATDPGRQSGFFGFMQQLMDQLEAMMGQLPGSPPTPVPVPVNDGPGNPSGSGADPVPSTRNLETA